MKKEISEEDRIWLENYEYKFRHEMKEVYENPCIVGLVRLRCRDWLDLAMAVVEKYGDEGRQMVYEKRLNTARTCADEVRKKYGTDVQAIHKFYQEYLPWWEPVWDLFLGDLPKKMVLRMKCQCGEYWKERLEQGTATRDLCRLWCEWDLEFAKALNPKIKYELGKWMPDGDPYCEHVWNLT
jgi:hypothetical protein